MTRFLTLIVAADVDVDGHDPEVVGNVIFFRLKKTVVQTVITAGALRLETCHRVQLPLQRLVCKAYQMIGLLNLLGVVEGSNMVDPGNPHNSVRVILGNPRSPFANSRRPYVRISRNGQAIDNSGNVVAKNSLAARGKSPACFQAPLHSRLTALLVARIRWYSRSSALVRQALASHPLCVPTRCDAGLFATGYVPAFGTLPGPRTRLAGMGLSRGSLTTQTTDSLHFAKPLTHRVADSPWSTPHSQYHGGDPNNR